LMHRFWVRRSMENNLPPLIAAACVFIASKVDESPRSLRDFAYVYIKNKNPKGAEALQRISSNMEELLQSVMEDFLTAERAIMYTIEFDFRVDHPYPHIVNGLKKLGIQSPNMTTEEAALFQHTVSMVNDSLSTTLSLRYDGSKIAHAAIFVMAGESNFKLPLPEGVTFFEFFSIPEAELDDMRPQLLAPYKKKPSTAPTPAKPANNSATPNATALAGLAILVKPNGLPIPKFKVITDLSAAMSSKELEEGELPPSKHEVDESGEALQHNSASPAPNSGDTSGERNNNNESVGQLVCRKRTRSPEHDEPSFLETSTSFSTHQASKGPHVAAD